MADKDAVKEAAGADPQASSKPRRATGKNFVPARKLTPAMYARGDAELVVLDAGPPKASDPQAEGFSLALPGEAPALASGKSFLDNIKQLNEERAAAEQAGFSIRRACNGLKVSAKIVSALIRRPGANAPQAQAGQSAAALVQANAKLSELLLDELGHKNAMSQPAWVIRSIMNTTSSVVAEAWCMGQDLNDDYLAAKAKELAIFATVDAPAIDPELEQPEGELDPARLTLINALAPLAAEIEDFDLFLDPGSLLDHAAGKITEAARNGVASMAPESSDSRSRLMLLQNLITNGAMIYTSAYSNYSQGIRDHIRALKVKDMSQARAYVADNANGFSIEPVDNAFSDAMGRLVRIVSKHLVPEEPQAAPAKRQVGMGA